MTDIDNETMPVNTIRVGSLLASIRKERDGFYTASIDRRYKDTKTGERKISTAFSVENLLVVRRVVDMAIDEIIKLERQDFDKLMKRQNQSEA